MFHSYRGRLLVAMPPLSDPNFDRSIVFMLEHSPDAALGVIINRPTGEHVDQLARWMDRTTSPQVVFSGGPVETTALIALGRRDPPTAEATGWAPLASERHPGLGTVNLVDDPTDVPTDDLRIFRGYAGWGPGQLDEEVAVQAWVAVDARAGDLFDAEPLTLWRQVLRRQPGELAWLANFPANPDWN